MVSVNGYTKDGADAKFATPGDVSSLTQTVVATLPTGTDATAALLAAISAAPAGSTLLVPKGEYRLGSPNNLTLDKSIDIDFNGSTLVNGTTAGVLNVTGEYETVYAVSALSVVTLVADGTTWNSTDMPGVSITLPSDPGWSRGDLIKIVADDPLEGQRYEGTASENPAVQARYGQHMRVYDVNGSTVRLQGVLREATKYATNIRAARLPQNQLSIRNVQVTISDTDFVDETTSRYGFKFEGLYRPHLDNVVVLRSHGAAFSFSGCYEYSVVNSSVGITRNRTSPDPGYSASYGYGVYDSGSEYGQVSNCVFGSVRHAFTDDSTRGGANRSVASYGRTFGTKISDCSAYGTSGNAWDTHLHGDSVTFSNCSADGCYGGFSLRGIRHGIFNGRVVDCEFGLFITDEHTNGGWSWGHVVNGLNISNAANAIRAVLREGGPNNGVRESRPNTLSNITVRGQRGPIFAARNSVNRIHGLSVQMAGTTNAPLIRCDGAARADFRDVTVDFGTVVHTSDLFTVSASTAQLTVSDYMALWATAPTYLLRVVAGTGNKLSKGVVSSVVSSSFGAGNLVSWTSDGTESIAPGAGLFDNGDLTVTALTYLLADIELANNYVRWLVNDTARTLPNLPNGRVYGQSLILWNNSTSTQDVSIDHGSAPNTLLIGAATQTLTPGQRIHLIWTQNRWLQAAPVA